MDGATPTADWLSDFFDSFDADDVGAFDGANAFADVPTEVIWGEGARVRAAGTKRKATEEADGSQDERVAVTATSVAATSVAATTAAATTATGRSHVLSEGAKKAKSTPITR